MKRHQKPKPKKYNRPEKQHHFKNFFVKNNLDRELLQKGITYAYKRKADSKYGNNPFSQTFKSKQNINFSFALGLVYILSNLRSESCSLGLEDEINEFIQKVAQTNEEDTPKNLLTHLCNKGIINQDIATVLLSALCQSNPPVPTAIYYSGLIAQCETFYKRKPSFLQPIPTQIPSGTTTTSSVNVSTSHELNTGNGSETTNQSDPLTSNFEIDPETADEAYIQLFGDRSAQNEAPHSAFYPTSSLLQLSVDPVDDREDYTQPSKRQRTVGSGSFQ